MKFIHTADIHLGAAPDSSMSWTEERADEIWNSFYLLLDTAAGSGVDLLVIAGDLFHRQPYKQELAEINYRFSKMPQVRIVLMAGNHDYLGEGSAYKDFEWADNVIFLKRNKMAYAYIAQLNTMIYGMSYDRAEIPERLADNLRPMHSLRDGTPLGEDCFHMLMLHGGDAMHIPVNMKELEGAGFDYVALGHIHKPWISESGKAAYSGALEPVDRNDEGPHGYILGESSPEGLKLSFVPFAMRSYISEEILLSPEMTMQEICDVTRDRITARGIQNMYKLIYRGVRNTGIELDETMLSRLGRVLSVSDETEADFNFDRLYESNKHNIIGRYIYSVAHMDLPEELKKKTLYYGIKALTEGMTR